MKKFANFIIALALVITTLTVPALAKTTPAGQIVGNVLFSVTSKNGDEILVSQIPISEMEADLEAGKVSGILRNYSLLDRFVTTVHQEGQGFTVPEFIDYAKSKSPVPELQALNLNFSGASKISFWEIDQTGFDELDSYTYADLYGAPRYNFPTLYEYWNYETQDYYDPVGKMTREQVIDHIFKSGEPTQVILAVRAFSQRYMLTSEKFGSDYNMENYWQSQNLLDNARAIRIMKPMTKEELYNKTPTASDSRYWTANVRLDMDGAPDITPLGKASAPTAVMTEDDDNYYIRFFCETLGATVLYNHNYSSPSYTPTVPYGGSAVTVPKSAFPGGTVTMTARAVKEGYADVGVITLKLTSSGGEKTYSDVPFGAWYAEAVRFVMDLGLFDLMGADAFSPEAPMTRLMLAEALYRLEGSPGVPPIAPFEDCNASSAIWAYSAGIVNGVGDGRFAPDGEITREQIAAMFFRYANLKNTASGAVGDLSAFSDAAQISSWAAEALTWAVGQKIINGMGDGRVAPQGTATRAQVAQILLNYAG